MRDLKKLLCKVIEQFSSLLIMNQILIGIEFIKGYIQIILPPFRFKLLIGGDTGNSIR